MNYRGIVKNGVIVPIGKVEIPEGTTVTIHFLKKVGKAKATRKGTKKKKHPLDLSDLAVHTGIPDLAENIDHYLYGHPKQKP
ncbi:MAG TPA: hypothetical protein VEJ63_15045 [Planctomycetota bacterium]|nr:hypothetical protein [Planctomycetota bacterium]